jgi:sulfhydrogenase subunit beta (sulfur reductase)
MSKEDVPSVTAQTLAQTPVQTIDQSGLAHLFAWLKQQGYQLLGPTIQDGAIVYDELDTPTDLPIGWTDEQAGGTYRLKPRDDAALFGYNVGPHSWKKYLFQPHQRLWQADRQGQTLNFTPDQPQPTKRAFIGVRACELAAIKIQDRVFGSGAYGDPHYQAQRQLLFIVAVNCGQAGNTCFCTSMATGPAATTGFDLALTEVLSGDQHYFVVTVGSAAGLAALQQIPHQPATELAQQTAQAIIAHTAQTMGRQMATQDLKATLYQNLEHPRWDVVADRCLTCANCTMACPTCFCSTVEDVTDLTGDHTERWRSWDSCFTLDFSYTHGGTVRSTAKSRYRQWLTHKLASWHDQFDTSGCVGCGRCITWCPVGIDLTEEVAVIQTSERTPTGEEV